MIRYTSDGSCGRVWLCSFRREFTILFTSYTFYSNMTLNAFELIASELKTKCVCDVWPVRELFIYDEDVYIFFFKMFFLHSELGLTTLSSCTVRVNMHLSIIIRVCDSTTTTILWFHRRIVLIWCGFFNRLPSSNSYCSYVTQIRTLLNTF